MHPKYTHEPLQALEEPPTRYLLYSWIVAAVMVQQDHQKAATKFLRHTLEHEPDFDRLAQIEAETGHETAAYVQYIREAHPELADRLYIGLTSSDLQDTAEALMWKFWWPQIANSIADLTLKLLSAEPGVRSGRTHGQDTREPVRISHLYGRAIRDLADTVARIEEIPLRANLSGPVGTFSEFLPFLAADHAARSLELHLDVHATQTAGRHRWAELAFQLTQLIGVYEQLATYHRLSSITGVNEYREGQSKLQKGSSSMPHKANPIQAEQVCGLARVARSNLAALTETWRTQWWERDLTNSSVERTAWRDLMHLTGYLTDLVAGWDFELNWNPALQETNFVQPTPFTEYNQRVVAGEDPEKTYREIQSRG